jgi:SAM-dependent methyltransferase
MTKYEIFRRGLEPILPPLYKQARAKLLEEVNQIGEVPLILDVGGRRSPYTIGLPARITIIDLPRETEIQESLGLGMTEAIVKRLQQRRSNIEAFVFGDMTRSDLPSDSFDLVVSVEVLEHVEDDESFVREVCRVLKPGGKFLMTTPNGDYVENHNPDHKRHYKQEQLFSLLSRNFENVTVEYAIAGGYFRKLGLRSWSAKHPVRTASSIVGNIVNAQQSKRPGIAAMREGTHHLFAVGQKLGESN